MRRITNIVRRSRLSLTNNQPVTEALQGPPTLVAPEPEQAWQQYPDDSASIITELPAYALEDDASIFTVTEPPAYALPPNPPDPPPYPGPVPESYRQTWLRDMRMASPSVRCFVLDGGRLPGQDEIAQFLRPTITYVDHVGMYFGLRHYDSDDALLVLVQEGMAEDDHVLAVLSSCTSQSLSLSVASMKLQSLITLDTAVYLRCLIVAIAARSDLAGHQDAEVVHNLHSFPTEYDSGNALASIETCIQSFSHCHASTLVPVNFAVAWLHGCGAISALRRYAVRDWEGQKLASAYRHFGCVQNLANILGEEEVLDDMDDHSCQRWQALLCWRPDVNRLYQWEFGCLSPQQHCKLSRLLATDGPDTATGQQSSLGKSEPACYEFIRVETRTTQRLEEMLLLLSKVEKIGTYAVELFIRFFIDNPAEDAAFSEFNQVLCSLGTDDASFRQCLDAFQPQDDLDICSQVMQLIKALPLSSMTRISNLAGNVAARIEELMSLAQSEFVAQLDIGPADYIGVCILDFGRAILDAPHLHEQLSPTFLAMVRRFPERDIADAIFQRLEYAVVETSGHFSPLRSHLISCLGGRRGYYVRSVDVADIQSEANFWKTCQDPDRRELARVLSSLKCLDYKAYTACLVAVVHEKSMFVKELQVQLIEENRARVCANLVTYLAGRRSQGQLTAHCWTLLLVALIEERGDMLLQHGSPLRSTEEWLGFVQGLLRVVGPVIRQFDKSSHGDSITQQRLVWWQTLSRHEEAFKQIKTLVKGFRDVNWIYIPKNEAAVGTLLQHAQMGPSMSTTIRLVISLLAPDGSNLVRVVNLLNSLARLSQHGKDIIETTLSRAAIAMGASASWTKTALAASIQTWLESSLLTPVDKDVLRGIADQLDVRLPASAGSSDQLLRLLHSHYSGILKRAQDLETKRWKFKYTNTSQHAALLQGLGIREAVDKVAEAEIPSELVDAVEQLDLNEYEMSFPLTGLSDLQRQARGVPTGARLLVVRARLEGTIGFCIHYSSIDEPECESHRYWQTRSKEPDQAICSARPSLFGYYLARKIHRLLKTLPPLDALYNSIHQWIAKAPATCSVCGAGMGVKLWKMGSCSQSCSLLLRKAPLEVRLHNLLVDPLSLDLLLASVYAASLSTSGIELLPGCPIAKDKLPSVINSLPAMATLRKGEKLNLALLRNPLGSEQEKLLSWLCLSFRGFMRSAPLGYVIPSIPGSQQFLVLNAHRERELAFEKHLGASGAGSGPVFHGTDIERLFLIMSTGIKNLSGQRGYMANGAARGPGVYCGDDQQTSWVFARPLGKTWTNSALNPQMHLMLGCELAKYPTVSTQTHVVQDETRVLVRYVLLLQPNSTSPPRRHVAPAMSTAFAKLRSGKAS